VKDPIAFYQEIFAEFGALSARRMFGGFGIYHQDVMFAIVFDDILYLKCNDANAEAFRSRGLERLTYTKGGRNIPLSYYRAPDEIMDDPQEAAAWGRAAFGAALASAAERRRKTGSRRKPERSGKATSVRGRRR
jgi:DNA transformation protein